MTKLARVVTGAKSVASADLLEVIKDEYVLTEGSGKWLLIAILANILPIITFVAFIPFVSQIVTALVLVFFWKRYIKSTEKEKIEAVESKTASFTMSKLGYVLIWITIIIQLPLAWVPYLTQVTSTILLGIIYATMTKYKE
jgi:biotin transporter BioY